MDWMELFGEPISVYTDAQALEDGVLVDVSSLNVRFQGMLINRITQHLWGDFESLFPNESELNGQASPARCERNVKRLCYWGGIWTLPPNVWIIENEVAGWTLMYPEDY